MRSLHPALFVLIAAAAGGLLGAAIGLAALGVDPTAAAEAGAQALDGGGGQLAPAGGVLGAVLAFGTNAAALVGGALAGVAAGAVGAAVVVARRPAPPASPEAP